MRNKTKWLVFGYLDEFGYVGSFWEICIRPKLCWLLGHKEFPFPKKTMKELKENIDKYHSGSLKGKYFCGKCNKKVKLPLWFRIINHILVKK